MLLNWRTWLWRSFSIGLFLAGLYWLVQPSNPFYQPNTDKPEAFIDAYMENATALRFNPDGSLRERIHMAHWQHIMRQQTTEMLDLNLHLYRQDGMIWNITANQGYGHHSHLGAQLEYVLLEDDVNITHGKALMPNANEDWRMQTQALTVYPTYAQTDLPVTVSGPDATQIDAIGLKAYLETGYVEFLNQVKTHYSMQTL